MARDSYTPEEIQKKFDALPADIKTAVYGADMLNLIQKLGEKYKLHIDQTGALEAETADVMTGFTKSEEFIQNLSEALTIDRDMAENIAKDINEQLFVKIQDSMKKIKGDDSAQKPPLSASIPMTPTVPQVPAAPQPPKPDLSAADAMLQSKIVSTPAPAAPPPAAPKVKEEPPKPANYSADPYREPPL